MTLLMLGKGNTFSSWRITSNHIILSALEDISGEGLTPTVTAPGEKVSTADKSSFSSAASSTSAATTQLSSSGEQIGDLNVDDLLIAKSNSCENIGSVHNYNHLPVSGAWYLM